MNKMKKTNKTKIKISNKIKIKTKIKVKLNSPMATNPHPLTNNPKNKNYPPSITLLSPNNSNFNPFYPKLLASAPPSIPSSTLFPPMEAQPIDPSKFPNPPSKFLNPPSFQIPLLLLKNSRY